MTSSARAPQRAVTPGQLVALGLLLAAIAALARWHDGSLFWAGSLVGVAGVAGYFVQFDTPRGFLQWLLAALGLCMAFMFAVQLLVGALT
ncbi:hypothetical protein [Streptomyces sp. XH2]|uniref:hypothetical protein n=1 Tax=Streptomyces sp. XH2 TaxID=3412483 RepID=UPI003C7A040C